jgi:putative peptidoglycan lipid II flippase
MYSTKNSISTKISFSFLMIFSLSFLQKCLAFGRDFILTSRYGASFLTDAFYIALSIPEFFVVFTGIDAVQGTSTSLLAPSVKKNPYKFMRGCILILLCTLLYSLLFCIVAFASLRYLIQWYLPGYHQEQLSVVLDFSYKALPLIALVGVFKYLTSVAGVMGRFFLQNIGEVFVTSCVVLSILNLEVQDFSKIYYVYHVSYMLSIVFLMLFLVQYKNIFQWVRIKLIWIQFKQLSILIYPLLLVTGMSQLARLTDKGIASYFEEGIITAISLSNTLASIFGTLIVASLMKIYFPKFSEFYHSNTQKTQVQSDYSKSLILAFAFLTPITLFLFFHSELIIKAAYFRGDFTIRNVETTSQNLFIYNLTNLLAPFHLITTYILLVAYKNKHIGKVGILSFSSNIVFSLLFSWKLGYIGIPLGTLTAYLLYTWGLNHQMRKHTPIKIPSMVWKYLLFSLVFFGITIASVKWIATPFIMNYANIIQLFSFFILSCCVTPLYYYWTKRYFKTV